MKSIYKISLISSIIVLFLSVIILQINTYLDTYYKGICAIINRGAYFSLIVSSYVFLDY